MAGKQIRSKAPLHIPANRKRVMLMVDTSHGHGRSVLAGIADYIDDHAHWQIFLEPDVNARIIRRANVDGIISETAMPGMYQAMADTRIPAITVAGVPIENGPPAVIVDNRAVGRMAGNHLADLGLKTIGYVPRTGTHYSMRREEGLREACTQRGLAFIRCSDTAANREAHLVKWLLKLPKPIGILASNDRVALAVSRACRLADIHIPEQVALMGVDNEEESCRLADPPLTSVDHGTRRIGYEAARLLDQWLTTGKRPEKSVLVQPIGVLQRPSTDLLAISDPDVVSALRFIRDHAGRLLNVSDVLQYVSVSRRSLELHFQKSLGRTIHEEIMRVRIDRAKHQLINSDESLMRVARSCGFSFPSQFSRAFAREVGITPLQFRHQSRCR